MHDEMWKQEIKTKKYQMHNEVYLELMSMAENQTNLAGMNDEELYDYYYNQGMYPEGDEGEMMQGEPGMNAGMYAEDDQYLDVNDLDQRDWASQAY